MPCAERSILRVPLSSYDGRALRLVLRGELNCKNQMQKRWPRELPLLSSPAPPSCALALQSALNEIRGVREVSLETASRPSTPYADPTWPCTQTRPCGACLPPSLSPTPHQVPLFLPPPPQEVHHHHLPGTYLTLGMEENLPVSRTVPKFSLAGSLMLDSPWSRRVHLDSDPVPVPGVRAKPCSQTLRDRVEQESLSSTCGQKGFNVATGESRFLGGKSKENPGPLLEEPLKYPFNPAFLGSKLASLPCG
jgi:hypothetical protein